MLVGISSTRKPSRVHADANVGGGSVGVRDYEL